MGSNGGRLGSDGVSGLVSCGGGGGGGSGGGGFGPGSALESLQEDLRRVAREQREASERLESAALYAHSCAGRERAREEAGDS